MPRHLRRLAPFAALLALLCGGCRLQLTLDVEARRDGGGTLGVSLYADREALEAAQRAGASPLEGLREAGEALDGWTVDDGADAGGRTVTLSTTFDDPAEFERLTRDLATSLNADEAALLQPLAVRVDGAVIEMDGAALLRPGPAVRDYGLTPQQVVRRLQRDDVFDYVVRVRFPGAVQEAPGAVVEGRTAIWTVPPGQAVAIRATARRPPHPAVLIATGLGGGLVAGALAWWLWRRRRPPAQLARTGS